LLIGLLGNSGINAPLYVYISRWFDKRRGTALALISSGQYIAGAIWPPLFAEAIASHGWRMTMFGYGLLEVAIVVPMALVFLRRPPELVLKGGKSTSDPTPNGLVLGLRPNTAFAVLASASFFCCVPMAMPSGHLIAYCGDVGLTAQKGAAMLSVLLGCAFLSRQFWGWVSDRIGGLYTILYGSAFQALAIVGFGATQDEAGLFFVAAAFGIGFAGIIPAYVLVIRELFAAREASWRVPIQLLCGGSGMAAGGWLAGEIYDQAGFYAPAFATGVLFNIINLLLIGFLVYRREVTSVRVAHRYA
jgi:MFS family permease